MPKAFDQCREAGGKIRTIQLSHNRYVHVCIKDGKQVRGYIKTKKRVSTV